MKKEDYVSLEVAKLLKDKGYGGVCSAYYYKGKLFQCKCWNQSDMYEGKFYASPTLYEAQKWLWRKYELLVTAFLEAPFGKPYNFIYCIQDAKNSVDNHGTVVSDGSFGSIQEAINAGILEALKLI